MWSSYYWIPHFNHFDLFLITEAERKAAWEEYENEKKGINTMVNTTNLNMGVVMNQINPEVIRVSTEYYSLLILNNKICAKLASKKFLYIGI